MVPRLGAVLVVLLAGLAVDGAARADLGPPHRWCFRHLAELRSGGAAAARATTAVCPGDTWRGFRHGAGPSTYVVTPAGSVLCLHHGTGLDARAPRAVLLADGVTDPGLLQRAAPTGIFGDDGAASQLALVAVVLLALVWRLVAGRLESTGRGLYLLVLPVMVFAGWPGMLAPMNSYYAPLVSRALWWGLMARLAVALLVVEAVVEGVAAATDALD